MADFLVQFGASLAAVAALVVLAHFLGFSRGGRITSADEARAMLRLAPGGFEALELELDQDGQGAIARDCRGRIALLLPHGGHFVARILPPDSHRTVSGGVLVLARGAALPRAIALRLGKSAADWASETESVS